jgi:RimJ/RimL family protein N-acetyltransferase
MPIRGRNLPMVGLEEEPVQLRNITAADLELYEAIHTDPRMMEHLGGPLPREGLAEKLRRDAADTQADRSWVLVIVPDDEPGAAAGTVAIWEHEWEGRTITEIGWMVLPGFQGRGLGKRAVRAALDRVRARSRWDVVHAFPPVSNARSNAMCRSLGFEMVEAADFRFRDRLLRCNHWRLEVSALP